MTNILLLSWKKLFRDKVNTFWILCFPIVLGTLFNLAFSNLAKDEKMSPISVAVVLENDDYADALKSSIDGIASEDDPMLIPTYCTEDEAMSLLKDKEITGIIYSGENATLTISGNMTNDSLNQSILQAFTNEYNMYQDAIINILNTHPEKLVEVLDSFESKTDYNKTVSLSRDDGTSPFTQYFYNLLAMTSLFTAVGGVKIATDSQANLSALGARKCVSPTNKLLTMVIELIATTTYEFVLNILGFCYLAYVLKVDILSRLPLTFLSLFIGCLTGVSLGLFIGSIGRKQADFKQGMVFAITMPMCFLSGLMIGNMRMVIQNSCPIVNKFNPAALITDCYYTLTTYDSLNRFTMDIATLICFSCLFILFGFLITRRQRYASL